MGGLVVGGVIPQRLPEYNLEFLTFWKYFLIGDKPWVRATIAVYKVKFYRVALKSY